MTTKLKSKTAVNLLIQAGKEEAKNVQEIKSVAAPKEEVTEAETKVTEEVSAPAIEEPIINQEEVATTAQEAAKTDKKGLKGLAMLLAKREVKDSEAVKIPRELHRELKMLATLSGSSMMQMLGNLIEDFYNENQKEIASYKRKYLK